MKFKLTLILFYFSFITFSQEKVMNTIGFKSKKVSAAFLIIEKEYDVKFSYSDKILENKTLSLKKKKRSLNQLLFEISEILNLNFQQLNKRYISVTQEKSMLDYNANELNEVVLTSYLAKGISKNKDGSFRIDPKKLEILPGLIEADILESIQELPGVISPNETATGLNVRGGTPDQNQIIWDGIPIYHSGHLFGMISPFNANITKSVTFLNKGITPKYGESISSVIDISTNNNVANDFNLGLGLNGVSADFFIETPIIKNKLSILVSNRKSYEDIYQTGAFHELEEKVFQSTNIHNAKNSQEKFNFTDNTLKLNYQLNKNNLFSASYIHIDNELEHYYENIDNTTTYKDILGTENNGYSLTWRKTWNKSIKQLTLFSTSDFSLNYNFLTSKNHTQVSDFDKENYIKNKSFSSEITISKDSGNTMLYGFESSFKDVRYSFFETTNTKQILDAKSNTLNSYSLYTNYSNRSFPLFDFNIGLRASYYQQLSQFRIEPRIILYKNLTNFLKLQVTADIRNQTISQIDETLASSLALENKLWRVSDGNETPILNSKQISFGILYHKNGWSLDIDSYIKNTYGNAALSLGFLNTDLNHYLIGNQKIKGIDFYLKNNFNHIKIWISYSYTDIKSKFNTINNNNYFTANNQIKHAISSSIAYKTKKVQIALGWKWHSGKPYTQSTLNTADNSLIFNGVNTGRLANYKRLDFSAVYNFSISKKNKLKGKIGLSIRNLTNQTNQISREYIGKNTPNNPTTIVDKYSLGKTTNFVFRIEW